MKKRADSREIAYLAAEHQANLILLASAWAEAMRDTVKGTDNELLGALPEFLEGMGSADYTAEAQKRYLELQRKILMLRAKSFRAALDYMTRQSEALAENEAKWAKAITKKIGAQGLNPVGTGRIAAVVKYANVEDGMTLEESIEAAALEDARRISSICRDGLRRNQSIDEISRSLRGTKAGNYEDGVLNLSRSEAEQLARTGCCGIADEAKMQFYLGNVDVILGVRHVATLSGNTCLVCGSYDGMVWKIPDEVHLIPKLGIHPNCRCVHLPVTEMDEINSSTRPAEAANFWKEAEEKYNREHAGKKRFSDLARSTRLKYYYQAQKDYEKRTGKPAFDQVPQNMSFEDWLKTKDDRYLESYFGKTRFALYKDGKLPLKKFINPETNRAFTIEELKKRDKAAFRRAGID